MDPPADVIRNDQTAVSDGGFGALVIRATSRLAAITLGTQFGKERVAAVGLALIAASAAVALNGIDIAHFWTALILLGLGWNFGFIGATAMVAECHTPSERNKVQGANDFLVFGTVATASFFSGSLLHSSGWETINWLVLPAVALVLVPLLWRAARPLRAMATVAQQD